MKVFVNGQASVQPENLTLSELLVALQLPEKAVLVERNRYPVAREDFKTTRLTEGDSVELVQMVAGG
ncbi:MAG: sulfur carrier protein ThiS [Verrucomicrobia bacterium]|nr:sulfur carrier protein ThiS [Verrucomicrobiota bacterium]